MNSVPKGWRLIPADLTPEMIAAFDRGFKRQLGIRHKARFKPKPTRAESRSAEEAGLREMLAASPQPQETAR